MVSVYTMCCNINKHYIMPQGVRTGQVEVPEENSVTVWHYVAIMCQGFKYNLD